MKQAKQRRMCEGKRRHKTAVGAGIEAEIAFQKRGEWVRPYKCRCCGGYHVGH